MYRHCVSMCVRMHESLLVISPEKKVQWHKKWDFCEFHNIEQIKTEEKWGFIDEKQSIRSSSLWTVYVCVSYTNIDGNGNGAWMLVRRLLLFPVRSYIAAYTLCLKWSRYAQK